MQALVTKVGNRFQISGTLIDILRALCELALDSAALRAATSSAAERGLSQTITIYVRLTMF